MKLICEVLEDVKYLEEDKNGKKGTYIEGIFMQGDIKNRNEPSSLNKVYVRSKIHGRIEKSIS